MTLCKREAEATILTIPSWQGRRYRLRIGIEFRISAYLSGGYRRIYALNVMSVARLTKGA